MVDDGILRQIEDRIDIVDLIAETTELKRKGNRYWGLCPFHQEKTPSFSVNRERGLYYCFGCHAGGNVFSFVMNTQGLTFAEAVDYLAERAGVVVPEKTPRARAERDLKKQLVEVNTLAMQFFEKALKAPEGFEARQYAKKRGISPETIEGFHLGFAPDAWNRLEEYLLGKGIDYLTLQASGLFKRAASGDRYYDLFRNRLIFPILDHRGQVVAFGGRALGDDNPKYLNSPETELYSKRLHLYGLFHARQAVREADCAILVEGYMDLISLYQHGVRNVVASLGTALTAEQARLLARYTSRVIIVYDGDEAGQRETLRAIEILTDTGLAVEVVTIRGAKDPDEYIRKHGKEEFMDLIKNNRLSHIEFKLRRAIAQHGCGEWAQKAKVLREIYPDLAALGSEIETSRYIITASQYVGLPEAKVIHDFQSWQRDKNHNARLRNKSISSRDNKQGKDSAVASLVNRIVARMLLDPAFFRKIDSRVGTDWVKDGPLREVIAAAGEIAAAGDDFDDLPRALVTTAQQAAYARVMMAETPASDQEAAEFCERISRMRSEKRRAILEREFLDLDINGDFFSMIKYMLKVEAHLRLSRKGG